MLRIAPFVVMVLLLGPIAIGIAGVVLPSFGVFPAIGAVEITTTHWSQLLDQPGLARSILLSLVGGLGTSIISVICVVLLLAASAEKTYFRWTSRFLSPLLSVPHAAAAFGLAFLIAPSGLLARLFSPWATGWVVPADFLTVHDEFGVAMMVGLIVKEVPFLLLMSLAALPQLDPSKRLMVGRSLGYQPMMAWLKTVFPSLYPSLRLPIFAVIAYASSTVDVAAILGPTTPPPLSVAVMRWHSDPNLSMRLVASAGAVLQLGVVAFSIGLWMAGEQLIRLATQNWLADGRRAVFEKLLHRIGLAIPLAIVTISVLSLTGLALNALAIGWRFPDILPTELSLRSWIKVQGSVWDAIEASILIACVSAGVSLIATVACLENERRRFRWAGTRAMGLLYMPLIVPQAAFLLGITTSFELVRLSPGIWPVVATHTIFVLPYVYLSLAGPYRQFDQRWIMVARSLGHSPNRAFWIVQVPLLVGPALAALAVGIAVSAGQYLATVLSGAGRVSTVTTEAVALSAGGERSVIGVWAMVQILIPLLGFSLALAIPRILWRKRQGMRSHNG